MEVGIGRLQLMAYCELMGEGLPEATWKVLTFGQKADDYVKNTCSDLQAGAYLSECMCAFCVFPCGSFQLGTVFCIF